MRKVAVIGVGLHRYGKWNDKSAFDLAEPAIRSALLLAGVQWEEIQSGWCGHTNLGMTAGARIFSELGKTGLSITNVENASATGSYAFRGAYLDVASGECDLALALGVDKRPRGIPKGLMEAGTVHGAKTNQVVSPLMKFARDTTAYMDTYGATLDQIAQVSVKQHKNAALNPYAQYQKEVTLDDVHNARMVAPPLTVLHCCPFGDGAAAAIVASEDVVERLQIKNPVWVAASVSHSEFDTDNDSRDLTAITAQEAYEKSGVGPDDVDMVELHDAFTIEEIMQAENLGLCGAGEGAQLVASGATEITGRIPINASGGLLAMGHPFGPTGLGQIAEIFYQLREQAGPRQIPHHPHTGLAHMIGLGGTCIIHIFTR